ncbi:MAG: chromosome segregation SMC family protein [Candidatus Actinomarina sp.]|tara:strand:+ start:1075 stop:3723 length:2649 start_codon:yes stop_codon:yes gene_type:complete
MHLKSIVAHGFKSFAEKTTINLSENTNVIVGPNGSGKSNIVDAISWVLGNQSPGSLRTNKMEDVIFAGTEKLTEKGFAEVFLVFNLDDKDEINSDEVSIGRKLYRDGTSEYFMNGLNCRLLDIQEFLNDVGIGKQQHIIISQGQIAEILNAKPEDHRITIEEASGILPFKLKKDKALRRIESGEKEIKRAKDVLREIKKQIDPLRKQAEQARLHKELSDLLKENKTKLNVFQYKNFNKKYEDIRSQLDEVNNFITEFEKKLEEYKSDKSKLRKDFGENVSIKSFLTEAITDVTKFNEEFKTIYQISSERQLSLERINEQSNSELKRYKNQIFDNNNKISQLSKSVIDKKQIIKINSKKIKNLMIEIDDLKSKQSASLEINEALLRSEINNLKLDLESKSEYLNKYSENINTWKKDDKTINKYLIKHDKYLQRKNLSSRSFNKVKINTEKVIKREVSYLDNVYSEALINKNNLESSLEEKLSLIKEYNSGNSFKKTLEEKEEVLTNEKAILEDETSFMNEELISSTEKIKFLTNENENISDKITELSNQNNTNAIKNYKNINRKASEAYKILSQLSEELSLRSKKLENDYSDNDLEINKIEDTLENISKNLFTYKDKKSNLMVKESEYMSQRALFYSNLTNISGLNIEEINAFDVNNLSINELENSINKTEKDLDSLGTVNYLASEDFESLNERYENISSNVEELNLTKKELLKYIGEIEEEIKFRIENSFNTISVNFEEVFEKLFPGGKGSLSLTNSDNLLESGIEINVQPRGKKVKKLSLLSGGERSLAAIAFLFSVFKSFPSPFYILDEVEAALDDANLHRMLNLLEFVKNDAQFIIVTHQQQTMQAGDVLYGVTMQPGSGSRVFTKTKKDFESLISKGE